MPCVWLYVSGVYVCEHRSQNTMSGVSITLYYFPGDRSLIEPQLSCWLA